MFSKLLFTLQDPEYVCLSTLTFRWLLRFKITLLFIANSFGSSTWASDWGLRQLWTSQVMNAGSTADAQYFLILFSSRESLQKKGWFQISQCGNPGFLHGSLLLHETKKKKKMNHAYTILVFGFTETCPSVQIRLLLDILQIVWTSVAPVIACLTDTFNTESSVKWGTCFWFSVPTWKSFRDRTSAFHVLIKFRELHLCNYHFRCPCYFENVRVSTCFPNIQ